MRVTSATAVGFFVVALALTLACSPQPKSEAPRAPSVSRPSDSVTPPLESGYLDFEVELAQFRSAHDLYRSALVKPEPVPPGFSRDRLKDARAPMAWDDVSSVRGYLYWNDLAPGIATFNRPGCALGPLTPDGALCPSTVVPGVELSPELTREFLDVLGREPVPEVPRACTCGGAQSPMHGFVLYDDAGAPMAVVTLNVLHHRLVTHPDRTQGQFGKSWVSDTFRSWYGDFCRRVGLPLCFYWNREHLDRFFAELERREISVADASPLEHVRDVPLTSLDREERRILCAYAHRNSFRAASDRSGDQDYGFESPEGERWTGHTLSWYACEERFPSCPMRLSEVLPCELAALKGDPGFFAPSVRHCRAFYSCLWGLSTSSRPLP